MDTPSPRKKKLLYDFYFFIFCMYIRNDVNRWTPLSEKSRSATESATERHQRAWPTHPFNVKYCMLSSHVVMCHMHVLFLCVFVI